ncbi:MAG: hypothetical protein CME04_09270 [Gemmatimonadaceae bacterium]|jgi:hypothetical protein|nr:hypothetical protein [Gemmatimonadaceae bacterium]|tara:strand:+ start:254 stop:1018 length:765 start_codon:yes stop_codon:yes gene_type:complete
MMLYAPLLTGLLAYRVTPLPAALLATVATALFFAQNALGLQLRGRAGPDNTRWLTGFVIVGSAAGAGLLFGYGLWRLLPLAAPAALLFAWQAWQRRQTRRQIDHSTANELVTAAVMALGASAAHLAAGHPWTAAAAVPWVAFALYFGGSVLYVKMRVRDARSGGDTQARWRHGLACALFHGGLGITTAGLALTCWPGSHFGALAGVATGPAILRALFAWLRLDGTMPSLQRIGVLEVVFASWFSLWLAAALVGL